MGRRRAHGKQVVHVSEAGGVEAQRLVERGRALPSPKEGRLRRRRAGLETEGRGRDGLSDARRGTDWWVGGMGRRGAHGKQVLHVSEAGGVEAQRLVERMRVLPSPKGGMLRGRQAGQETEGRGRDGLSDARRGPDWWVGGTGTRGAHLKHVLHVRDAGRVEAQRLVERIRVLPSAKEGMLRGRQAGQEAGGRGAVA